MKDRRDPERQPTTPSGQGRRSAWLVYKLNDVMITDEMLCVSRANARHAIRVILAGRTAHHYKAKEHEVFFVDDREKVVMRRVPWYVPPRFRETNLR